TKTGSTSYLRIVLLCKNSQTARKIAPRGDQDRDYESCKMMREDELVILESIYPSSITLDPKEDGVTELQIVLEINLAGPIRFDIIPLDPSSSASSSSSRPTSKAITSTITTTTSTLPPIKVHMRLPAGYPIYEPPEVIGISDGDEGDSERSEVEAIDSLSTSTSMTKPPTITTTLPYTASSHNATNSDKHTGSLTDRNGTGHTHRDIPPPEKSTYLPSRTLDHLRQRLHDLWVESGGEIGAEGNGGPVLWDWLDWVGCGEGVLESLERMVEGDGYILPAQPNLDLARKIAAHNRSLRKKEFDAQTWDCGICLDAKKGRFCVRFDGEQEGEGEGEGCGCVFCKECLSACWTLAIKEGNVESVACPSVTCTKRRVDRQNRVREPALGGGKLEGTDTGAEAKDRAGQGSAGGEVELRLVEEVVGVELRERLEWLKRKKRVENDPTYTTCPLQHCQSPVPPPPLPKTSTTMTNAPARNVFRIGTAVVLTDEQVEENRKKEEDKWERYRQCPGCRFSFCRYCLTTWHGPHLPCPLPSTSNFLKAYLALATDSPDRKIYHRRYGKKNLDRLQAEYEENEANKKWFEGNTRECCGCGTRVQKSQGCNHMICSKCNAHFCYRCGQSLRPSDPYMHFRTPGSCCFEKLFDADEIARFEREVGGLQDEVGWDDLAGGGIGGWW
ncbi:hypothetical protein HD553DRAFT_165373, partial [Filobasidium floriforme]